MQRICACIVFLLLFGQLSAQTSELSQYLESCPFFSEEDKKTLQIVQEGQSNGVESVFSIPTSALSSCHIRLYPMVNGTPLIGVIERITAPELDSRLSFYTPDWGAIPLEGLIELPRRGRFVQHLEGNTSVEAERLRQLLYPLHYDIRWAQGGAVVCAVSVQLSQEDEENEALKTLISKLPEYRFEWKNYRFEEVR